MPKVNTSSATQTVFNFDLPTESQNIQGSGISTGDGEYLGLTKTDGSTIASQFAPDFPRQPPGVSYGLTTDGLRYFTTPTPGAITFPK